MENFLVQATLEDISGNKTKKYSAWDCSMKLLQHQINASAMTSSTLIFGLLILQSLKLS
jgi:hypothetical protein